MTTKFLTGAYASGYQLESPTTLLSIAASGYVGGTGVRDRCGAKISAPVLYHVFVWSRSKDTYYALAYE